MRKYWITMDNDGMCWDIHYQDTKPPTRDNGVYWQGTACQFQFPELYSQIKSIIRPGECVEIEPLKIVRKG